MKWSPLWRLFVWAIEFVHQAMSVCDSELMYSKKLSIEKFR